jgi:serine/threonine protein kinase
MVLKFESLEPGLSRSSAGNSEDPQYTPSTNSVSLFSNDPVLRITLEGFVETLQLAGISGPVILIGRPEPLGEGGQFLVFKQEVIFLGRDGAKYSQVAIKRPRFPSVDGFPMDLASSQVERNLKHMANEVKALTNERLRNHPNIVKIFSWAWDLDYSGSLVLVLELAYEDLESALASDSPPSLSQRVQFCDDVANGLDAIHDADFVHGDLKPANVLVFLEASRPVAKLADFGYSVEHSGHTTTGTVGWQAPEKMASIAADCFSYGLLVWSTILLDGRIPKQAPNQSWIDTAITNLETRRDDLPQDVFVRLLKSVKSLLETDPMERCCHLGPFFANGLKSQEV